MEMKSILTYLFLLCIIPISANSSTINNPGDLYTGGIRIAGTQTLGGTDNDNLVITITVANLEEFGPQEDQYGESNDGGDTPDGGDGNVSNNNVNHYYLPEDYPTMYLTYSLGAASGSIEIPHFVHDGTHTSGEHLYTYTTTIYYESSNSNSTEDETTGQGDNNFFSLTTTDGSLYPVHDYGTPGDVFSCTVFQMTCLSCQPVCRPDFTEPYWLITELRNEEQTSSETFLTEEITISPNPSRSDFLIQIGSEENADIQIDVLDYTGKKIHQLNETTDGYLFQKRLDTNDWTNGIYFLNIKINEKQYTRRIIKI